MNFKIERQLASPAPASNQQIRSSEKTKRTTNNLGPCPGRPDALLFGACFFNTRVMGRGFRSVKRDLGTVIAKRHGIVALLIGSLICPVENTRPGETVAPRLFQVFSDLFAGALCFGLYVFPGALLLTSRKDT
jgi:hypothetical protein